MSKDLFAAISLANLSMMGVWNALLHQPPGRMFFLEHPPSGLQFGVAAWDTILLGFLFYGLIRMARRVDVHLRTAPFVFWPLPFIALMTMMPFLAVVLLTGEGLDNGHPARTAVILGTAFAASLFFGRKLLQVGYSVLLLLLPLIAIEGVRAAAFLWRNPSEFANGPLASRIPGNSKPRLVWIIFDELDYRLSFPERPKTLPMPEFDRLRAESLFAENATSPANWTQLSVLSLVTGTQVAHLDLKGPATALANGHPLDSQPTIFSRIHAMGGNSAVAGWYVPYCRLFSRDLCECSWHQADAMLGGIDAPFGVSAAHQLQSLFEHGHLSPFPQSLSAKHRIHMLNAIRTEALRDVVDPSINLTYLHFPIPHAPNVYDRRSRTFSKRNSGVDGYLDSLVLADSFLHDLRTAMTEAGMWDSTTVLVSSDHRFRSSERLDGKQDPRVPFLLKLAGQTSAVSYSAPLRTIVTKPLLEAIFQGKVSNPAQAVDWLSSRTQ